MNIEKMKIEEVVGEINRLYKISKERELTKEEKELQKACRKKYLDNVKRNLRAQLDEVKAVQQESEEKKCF